MREMDGQNTFIYIVLTLPSSVLFVSTMMDYDICCIVCQNERWGGLHGSALKSTTT